MMKTHANFQCKDKFHFVHEQTNSQKKMYRTSALRLLYSNLTDALSNAIEFDIIQSLVIYFHMVSVRSKHIL